MDKIFASRPGRIRFLLTIGLLVLVLVFIRYWLLPISFLTAHLNEIASSLSEKFITALVSAVIVGWFLYWVQDDEKKKAIDFTESKHQIEKYLTNARKGTNFWYFNGGLGRYSKSDTIPLLSKMAADENRTITLDLIVINPFNKDVVNKYVDFRKSLVSGKEQRNWSYEQAQSELLATIVTAFYYKRKNQFLRTSIRIKNYFSLSRMDISDSTAVITRENSSFPSIVALSGRMNSICIRWAFIIAGYFQGLPNRSACTSGSRTISRKMIFSFTITITTCAVGCYVERYVILPIR